jgi:rare lipoprotein A (peptidoglycan hydrolase)
MIAKAYLLVVALLHVTILARTSAADRKPDECGLASVYSSVSEETASGEDTLLEDFTAAHRALPFGTLVQSIIKNTGATRWCGSPIVARSSAEE